MRLALALVLAVLVTTMSAVAAWADAKGRTKSDGVETSIFHRSQLDQVAHGKDPQTGQIFGKTYDYTSTYACPFNKPGSFDTSCTSATEACAGNTPAQGQGPLTRIYRRELDSKGNPVRAWEAYGSTCHPEAAPGRPVLGLAQIIQAFRLTPWSKPSVHIQPEGNTTLVTLPAYFEVRWPRAGFQPGEVNTVTLLGYRVRIRPTLAHYTYSYGDGTTSGPTASPGGPYPTGDIQRGYDTAGVYRTGVTITYGGQFSVNGGEWVTIPDTVDVTGPTQDLTVRTAKNRLVTR